MPKYIEFYTDENFENLWLAVPVIELSYDSVDSPPHETVPIDGKKYKYFNGASSAFRDVPMPQQNTPFKTSSNKFPTLTTLYCKNGFCMEIQLSNDYGVQHNNRCAISQLRVGNIILDGGVSSENSNPLNMYFSSIEYGGTTYIGFIGPIVSGSWSSYSVIPRMFLEVDFWDSAIRKDYDYGTGTDEDGGQGTGKIPHTDIPLSATPSKIVPIGGRGLHAYRINAQAYGSLQGYLWGDSSTLAKSLWQKFNNKTHNPVSCIVGCFSLPEDFMPQGSGNTGINLAGLYLSPISGTCVSVGGSIGFVDKIITFGAIEPPFHNFLDYTAITCKIHVPFCGEMAIAPEQIIGSALTLRYRVDQLNGNIVATVKANGIVLGELSGNCAYNIPLSGGDDGTLQRLGAITSGVTAVVQDNVQGAMVAMQNGMNAGFSAQLVNSDLHGSTTACENRVPYLVWTYSGTAYTPDYAQAQGVPCEFSGNLQAFSGGYGEFEIMSNSPALRLVYDVMGATETEKQEITALLRNGVIV